MRIAGKDYRREYVCMMQTRLKSSIIGDIFIQDN